MQSNVEKKRVASRIVAQNGRYLKSQRGFQEVDWLGRYRDPGQARLEFPDGAFYRPPYPFLVGGAFEIVRRKVENTERQHGVLRVLVLRAEIPLRAARIQQRRQVAA